MCVSEKKMIMKFICFSFSIPECVEYSKLVVTYKKPPILIIDKQEIKENTCGFRVVPLIVGGELANRREFPHMVSVTPRINYFKNGVGIVYSS